jgi:2-polyprenyl-6-methoxyphenol hydroxylase-like FAD-dependent oxidoreductase
MFERRFDVLVAGAGVAGVAAALASARAGLRTALVEKGVLVGGLATAGLINIYLPLCDGNGRQVIHGIAEELLHLSLKYGPGDVPEGWQDPSTPGKPERQRYRVAFSPAAFVLALDEALIAAGVDLWLDTLVCDAVLAGSRVAGVEVENKSGRGRLLADCVVDATGDADVAYRAGAPCVEAGNWVTSWAIQASLTRAQRAAADPAGTSLLDVVRLGASPQGRGAPADYTPLHGTDGREVTQFVLATRRLLREHYAGVEDRHARFPVALPAMPLFRTTRRIEGRTTLAEDRAGVPAPTSVGLAPDWRRAGPIWELPYGALLPQEVTGLLAAGRCIAAAGDAWEVARVIPVAALTGHVAGLAAQLAVTQGVPPHRLAVADVQAALRHRGMPYHIADL